METLGLQPQVISTEAHARLSQAPCGRDCAPHHAPPDGGASLPLKDQRGEAGRHEVTR